MSNEEKEYFKHIEKRSFFSSRHYVVYNKDNKSWSTAKIGFFEWVIKKTLGAMGLYKAYQRETVKPHFQKAYEAEAKSMENDEVLIALRDRILGPQNQSNQQMSQRSYSIEFEREKSDRQETPTENKEEKNTTDKEKKSSSSLNETPTSPKNTQKLDLDSLYDHIWNKRFASDTYRTGLFSYYDISVQNADTWQLQIIFDAHCTHPEFDQSEEGSKLEEIQKFLEKELEQHVDSVEKRGTSVVINWKPVQKKTDEPQKPKSQKSQPEKKLPTKDLSKLSNPTKTESLIETLKSELREVKNTSDESIHPIIKELIQLIRNENVTNTNQKDWRDRYSKQTQSKQRLFDTSDLNAFTSEDLDRLSNELVTLCYPFCLLLKDEAFLELVYRCPAFLKNSSRAQRFIKVLNECSDSEIKTAIRRQFIALATNSTIRDNLTQAMSDNFAKDVEIFDDKEFSELFSNSELLSKAYPFLSKKQKNAVFNSDFTKRNPKLPKIANTEFVSYFDEQILNALQSKNQIEELFKLLNKHESKNLSQVSTNLIKKHKQYISTSEMIKDSSEMLKKESVSSLKVLMPYFQDQIVSAIVKQFGQEIPDYLLEIKELQAVLEEKENAKLETSISKGFESENQLDTLYQYIKTLPAKKRVDLPNILKKFTDTIKDDQIIVDLSDFADQSSKEAIEILFPYFKKSITKIMNKLEVPNWMITSTVLRNTALGTAKSDAELYKMLKNSGLQITQIISSSTDETFQIRYINYLLENDTTSDFKTELQAASPSVIEKLDPKHKQRYEKFLKNKADDDLFNQ